jgi:hypothetical protein
MEADGVAALAFLVDSDGRPALSTCELRGSVYYSRKDGNRIMGNGIMNGSRT